MILPTLGVQVVTKIIFRSIWDTLYHKYTRILEPKSYRWVVKGRRHEGSDIFPHSLLTLSPKP